MNQSSISLPVFHLTLFLTFILLLSFLPLSATSVLFPRASTAPLSSAASWLACASAMFLRTSLMSSTARPSGTVTSPYTTWRWNTSPHWRRWLGAWAVKRWNLKACTCVGRVRSHLHIHPAWGMRHRFTKCRCVAQLASHGGRNFRRWVTSFTWLEHRM